MLADPNILSHQHSSRVQYKGRYRRDDQMLTRLEIYCSDRNNTLIESVRMAQDLARRRVRVKCRGSPVIYMTVNKKNVAAVFLSQWAVIWLKC